MKKLILLAATALFLTSVTAKAALISVGPYSIDDTASISSISNYANLSANNGLASITDMDITTYLVGSNTTTPGSADLGFNTNIYNGTTDDLVFYFVSGVGDASVASFDINIGGITNTYDATISTFTDSSGAEQKYQVAFGSEFADLLVATVNLDDFNIAADGFITDFNISGINVDERLAFAAGFNVTPVPLPAPFLLLISGLAGLGLIGRRKK